MIATENIGNWRKTNWIEKAVTNKLFWVLAISFFFAYPILRSVQRQLPSALPKLGQMTEFSFTDENGKAFGTQELKGKVYLVHLMYSQCGGQCSLSLNELQRTQHRMRGVIDRAAIVSVSIDPEADSTAVLFGMARKYKANPTVWRFVNTTKEQLNQFVPTLNLGGTTHMDALKANKLVMVDQQGQMRGFYDIDKAGINRLMIDMGLLINSKSDT